MTNTTKQAWPKIIHLEKWSTGFSAHTQRAAHRTTYIRADLIKPIQAEPVGEVEDEEDSIVTWFVEPTNGMLLYTHPAPVNVLTDELKVELLEFLVVCSTMHPIVVGDGIHKQSQRLIAELTNLEGK